MSALVKTREAAQAVGLSRFFLYRHSSEISACYRGGKALRWDVQELRLWMRREAQKPSNNQQ